MSIRKDSYVWVGVGLVVIGVLVAGAMFMRAYQQTATVRLGDGVFTARVAATEAERQKGLGGVTALADHEALLFVYSTPQKNDVWMKDMKIPIDVVWLNEAKRVVHIETSLQPNSYPTTYGPSVSTSYVIELAEGVVRKKAIRLGAQAEFTVNSEKGGE